MRQGEVQVWSRERVDCVHRAWSYGVEEVGRWDIAGSFCSGVGRAGYGPGRGCCVLLSRVLANGNITEGFGIGNGDGKYLAH